MMIAHVRLYVHGSASVTADLMEVFTLPISQGVECRVNLKRHRRGDYPHKLHRGKCILICTYLLGSRAAAAAAAGGGGCFL